MLVLNRDNFDAYWRLMRADKPIGIYLLLWPAVWAVLLASHDANGIGMPELDTLFIFCIGVVLMRSAGCVINDYADRHFDGKVSRTELRPLATGEVTEQEALQLFGVLIGTSFLLVLTLNWQTIVLSIIALCLASIYPFMKRYTYLPQVVLGAAFGWSIPMAAMAILTSLPVWVWLLYLANLLWTVAYDTQYAMVDRKDDLKIGIKSSAILFGRYDLFVIAILHLCFLAMITLVCIHAEFFWSVYIFIGMALMLCIRQWYNTRKRNEKACFEAFLNNHRVGMLVAIGIASATVINW